MARYLEHGGGPRPVNAEKLSFAIRSLEQAGRASQVVEDMQMLVEEARQVRRSWEAFGEDQGQQQPSPPTAGNGQQVRAPGRGQAVLLKQRRQRGWHCRAAGRYLLPAAATCYRAPTLRFGSIDELLRLPLLECDWIVLPPIEALAMTFCSPRNGRCLWRV